MDRIRIKALEKEQLDIYYVCETVANQMICTIGKSAVDLTAITEHLYHSLTTGDYTFFRTTGAYLVNDVVEAMKFLNYNSTLEKFIFCISL